MIFLFSLHNLQLQEEKFFTIYIIISVTKIIDQH